MYHDDREIDAEKLITALDARVRTHTDLNDNARLLLLLVVIAMLGQQSNTVYSISQRLLNDPILASIPPKTLHELVIDAERSVDPSDDMTYLLTHLAAKLISQNLGLDYRHPKLIAALVGTIQSTLSGSLFEAIPNTAELSLGLIGSYTKDSFPMFKIIPDYLHNLISIRLAANDINARFITKLDPPHAGELTVLFDAPHLKSEHILSNIQDMLNQLVTGRLVLIQNWSKEDTQDSWPRLKSLIHDRGNIETIINFSTFPTDSDHCTAIIINTNPHQVGTLFIDVSMSNKSLPPLDGIERMLLAGCIYNLWQGRNPHSDSENLSSGVRRFINSYFSEGFRPIPRLCNVVDKRPRTMSKTRLVSRQFLRLNPNEGSSPTSSDNSKLIVKILEKHNTSPCCIYIIGNNGEGKSLLLRDIVYELVEAEKRSIGLPMSHADRFPVQDKSIKRLFEYKGARKTQIKKEVSAISSNPKKIKLLSECLELIGFSSRIYLTLKTELSHDNLGAPHRETLALSSTEDMQYLNRDKNSINEYEVNFIREGHRTVTFDNLSSGEQSIVSLLIKILASNTELATILIDEPEISLHVSWQQTLPRVLNLLSKRLQTSCVVATHSPIFIASATDEDICYVSRIGALTEIPIAERHSVETLLMDGFDTYTPNNKEVHERCAGLVASLILAANTTKIGAHAQEAIDKLNSFKVTIEKSQHKDKNIRQTSDLDLIDKTIGAITMLRHESDFRHG